MNNKELNELMKRDDWELEYLVRHKQNSNDYPITDKEKFKRCIMEDLCHCESGMYIGEGYHGGMTREEWKNKKEYLEKVLNELKSLMS